MLSPSRPDLPEVVLRVSTVALLALTAFVWTSLVHGHWILPAADLVLDTVAFAVSGTLAVLAWVRLRERDEPIALYHASAFTALACAYGTALVLSLGAGGWAAALAYPQSAQLYVFAAARFLAALLLVAAGLARWPVVARPASFAILLLPALIVIVVALAGPRIADALPALVNADLDAEGLPSTAPLGLVVQFVTAALFFAAAILCRTAWRRNHAVFDAWFAVALVFAGFAEILWAQYPSGHPGQVSIGDALRLAFFLVLLVGLQAEARLSLARLREANVELSELRASELERAALEERARLARELHDGLAQELWLAKLRAGELGTMQDLSPAARRLVAETEEAIDTGLAEARSAVFALRLAAAPATGVRGLLGEVAADFEDRYGIRVEFTVRGPVRPLPTRTQAEMLRIAQEALANVRRHADATVVRIETSSHDDIVELAITDNGRGFDTTRMDSGWYGVASMRERAAIVGGTLDIRSAPGEGTSVRLRVPVLGAGAPDGVAR
jgi:signal transduction histidine kinase